MGSPAVEALKLEGFYHFDPPCSSVKTPGAKCTRGSPWTETVSTPAMTGFAKGQVVLNATDEFHAVYDVHPVHLPEIHNQCAANDPSCVLTVSTVTQAVYDTLDPVDSGLSHTSASELRTKMKARQAYMAADGHKVAFNDSDVSNICAGINKQAYDYALTHASASATARFQKYGEPLVMGDDLGPYNAGPLWIWDDLKFKHDSSRNVTVVSSPMMRTPTSYWIKAAAGMHYCKVLSPARAMEHLMIDGLRLRRSIKNN